jgi:hypothetical protein
MKIFTCPIFVAAGFLAPIPAHTQTVLPISPRFPPPAGLTFVGRWECKAGDLTARLQVTPDRAPRRGLTSSAKGGWTTLTESQGGIAAHFQVGYDRDADQFLLFDADDPGYEVFRSDGWTGSTLTLTHVAKTENNFPANRFVYHVDNSSQFTVAWEERDNGEWKSRDT